MSQRPPAPSRSGDSQDERPVILIVDDRAVERGALERQFTRRYGNDYEVAAEASPAIAIGRLEQLAAAERTVALIVASQSMTAEPGTVFLARVRDIHPTAQRLLVHRWADFTARDAIVRATVFGEVDHVATAPMSDADERFHSRVSDALARWARETGRWGEAIRVVGERWDEHASGLIDAFRRAGLPFGWHDADSTDGRSIVEAAGIAGPLPIVLLADGRALPRPSPADVAGALGATTTPVEGVTDVVVLGAGPAGLAAAVYAASEGLQVLVVESMTVGGQASSSPLVRNYLGFPAGLGGSELAARAYDQAWTFGADFLIGRSASAIHASADGVLLSLDDGSELRAGSVVIATGVSYRRVGIESLERLVGRGIYYGSGATEAMAMAGGPVFVVGGANSAGEAAIYLARHAGEVTVLVRGPSIRPGMSDYLAQELESTSNIKVEVNAEVAEAEGGGRLQSLVIRDRGSGSTRQVPATGLFILIGAAPKTEWLPDAIARDERGFILTGADRPAGDRRDREHSLETTMAGVFAAGDVRHGSEKRVAAAVGEGSTAIRQVHEYRKERLGISSSH